FLFSSGRRHTRLSRDWSSDVCSSDLSREAWRRGFSTAARAATASAPAIAKARNARSVKKRLKNSVSMRTGLLDRDDDLGGDLVEIGGASCRERWEIWGVACAAESAER